LLYFRAAALAAATHIVSGDNESFFIAFEILEMTLPR
jgi:hypothetical protein